MAAMDMSALARRENLRRHQTAMRTKRGGSARRDLFYATLAASRALVQQIWRKARKCL